MRKLLILLLLSASTTSQAGIMSWLFGYESFDECILDRMPEVESDQEARVILKACKADYSATTRVEKIESYEEVHTAAACVSEYGQGFKNSISDFWVTRSCYRLFR